MNNEQRDIARFNALLLAIVLTIVLACSVMGVMMSAKLQYIPREPVQTSCTLNTEEGLCNGR